jgi:glycogen debranching enzyme
MPDVIKVEEKYYILATAARALGTSAVLKDGDTFAVFDPLGDIVGAGLGEQGLYHDGTRFLSILQMRLNDDRPLLLSSRSSRDNLAFGADLTNGDLLLEGRVALPKDVVHIFRSRFLLGGTAYERVRLANYSGVRIRLGLGYEFDADFADIFEVRGTPRLRRGLVLPPKVFDSGVELCYRGLDDEIRRTRLTWSPPPDRVAATSAQFHIELAPQETMTIELAVTCDLDSQPPRPPLSYDDALTRLTLRESAMQVGFATLESSNQQFNEWLMRSTSDVRMMITGTPAGPYPYAGVPWFNTPFGRDGIITALQLLWINPSIAAGVLRFLAETQATTLNAEQDAEPGKILHETRGGEMAALHEVPFGRYYGSVDATPLFVVLAGAYYRRTGDRSLIDSLWENIEGALMWIERYGDLDGDGFIEYARRTPAGLIQQGWKDSHDSVFHRNGDLAEPPIALAEVQAYAYGAWRAAAMLARARGEDVRATALENRADALRMKFEDTFWLEDIGTYALALDGSKRPCAVRTSNAGQCLLTGIARPDRARRVAESLISADMFSGWGIRTLAASEVRYNPMSYHNGSVWPHDNALIAAGLAHYGFNDLVQPVLGGVFAASLFFEGHRLPELFCGFHRRKGEGPTLYPVACSPQAWAAGTVFMLLQACLGLSVDAINRRISVAGARFPDGLDSLVVRDLALGEGNRIDLLFQRHDHDVAVMVLKREGHVEVIVTK